MRRGNDDGIWRILSLRRYQPDQVLRDHACLVSERNASQTHTRSPLRTAWKTDENPLGVNGYLRRSVLLGVTRSAGSHAASLSHS